MTASTATGDNRASRPPTVLVVEDDTIHLEIVRLYLEGVAHVEAAETGDDALREASRLCEGGANLTILMDLHMPGLSGGALAAALRDRCPGVRILGMSASDPLDEVSELLDDFLKKPLDDRILTEAVSWRTPAPVALQAAAERQAHPEHIRAETLAKLESMLPPDAMKRLFDVYLEDAENRIEVLHGCEKRWDNDCAALAAHALKGSSGMIGFECMAWLTSTLETHCIANDEFSLTDEIHAIEDELAVIRGLVAARVRAIPG